MNGVRTQTNAMNSVLNTARELGTLLQNADDALLAGCLKTILRRAVRSAKKPRKPSEKILFLKTEGRAVETDAD